MTSFHYLYSTILLRNPCYPEGNFGRNQLLDGSISLSPLYKSETTDLHVRTASSFHQRFLLASPSSCIVHHLSGLILTTLHQQLNVKWSKYFRSNRRILPNGIILVVKRISLVRVSRRVLVFKGSTCFISRSIQLPS